MNICRKDPGLPTDSFYEIRAGCTDVQETKFRIKVIYLVLLFFISFW